MTRYPHLRQIQPTGWAFLKNPMSLRIHMASIHPIPLTCISVYWVSGFSTPIGLCLTLGYFLSGIVFEVESGVFHPPLSNHLAPLFLREISKQNPRVHHLDPLLSVDCRHLFSFFILRVFICFYFFWFNDGYFPHPSFLGSVSSWSSISDNLRPLTCVPFCSARHLPSDYKERWPCLLHYSIIGFPHLAQFFFLQVNLVEHWISNPKHNLYIPYVHLHITLLLCPFYYSSGLSKQLISSSFISLTCFCPLFLCSSNPFYGPYS